MRHDCIAELNDRIVRKIREDPRSLAPKPPSFPPFAILAAADIVGDAAEFEDHSDCVRDFLECRIRSPD